jgi:threonylcarbamoyladenosine tRNA methylthiotransferase MtaB
MSSERMVEQPHLRTVPRTAMVRVLGCKVNQAEAAGIGRLLEERGFLVVEEADDPDLIVVNTCCVTARAEGKSRRAVSAIARRHPQARLIVTGCLAEINPVSVVDLGENTVVLGTAEKDSLARFLDTMDGEPRVIFRQGARYSTTFGQLDASGMAGRGRAFLKVQDGCSQRCTYCIVPDARGPSRSMPLAEVRRQARSLTAQGFGELVLSGVHLGWYGRDLGRAVDLKVLLETLLDDNPGFRLRLSSLEPQEVSASLIELISDHPRMCRHLHLPLQSGDDAILRRMGRPYDRAFILDLCHRLHQAIPDICIGMDVMVGFPGEDEAAFQATRQLLEACSATYLHVFPYSPRPGTPAAAYTPRVPQTIAQERVKGLQELSRTFRTKYYGRFVGKIVEAVAESSIDPVTQTLQARSDHYLPLRVTLTTGVPAGARFAVVITELRGNELYGLPADEASERASERISDSSSIRNGF